MGISIEQYRSRIGSHDNFLKTKDILSRLKDHFLSLMFTMFYLNVFYLPVLKQVVDKHKMRNDVMFWFSQLIFYNASYIPLVIRQANDVEENPGPTTFDVINPARTICADYSQGNEVLFGENAELDLFAQISKKKYKYPPPTVIRCLPYFRTFTVLCHYTPYIKCDRIHNIGIVAMVDLDIVNFNICKYI